VVTFFISSLQLTKFQVCSFQFPVTHSDKPTAKLFSPIGHQRVKNTGAEASEELLTQGVSLQSTGKGIQLGVSWCAFSLSEVWTLPCDSKQKRSCTHLSWSCFQSNCFGNQNKHFGCVLQVKKCLLSHVVGWTLVLNMLLGKLFLLSMLKEY